MFILVKYRVGRKKAMLASIILYLIPNIGVTFTTDVTVFIILRFLSGMSVGGLLGTGFVMGKSEIIILVFIV